MLQFLHQQLQPEVEVWRGAPGGALCLLSGSVNLCSLLDMLRVSYKADHPQPDAALLLPDSAVSACVEPGGHSSSIRPSTLCGSLKDEEIDSDGETRRRRQTAFKGGSSAKTLEGQILLGATSCGHCLLWLHQGDL